MRQYLQRMRKNMRMRKVVSEHFFYSNLHNLLKVKRMGMMLSQMKKEFTITKKKKERKPMVMKKMIEMKLFHIMDMKIAV